MSHRGPSRKAAATHTHGSGSGQPPYSFWHSRGTRSLDIYKDSKDAWIGMLVVVGLDSGNRKTMGVTGLHCAKEVRPLLQKTTIKAPVSSLTAQLPEVQDCICIPLDSFQVCVIFPCSTSAPTGCVHKYEHVLVNLKVLSILGEEFLIWCQIQLALPPLVFWTPKAYQEKSQSLGVYCVMAFPLVRYLLNFTFSQENHDWKIDFLVCCCLFWLLC